MDNYQEDKEDFELLLPMQPQKLEDYIQRLLPSVNHVYIAEAMTNQPRDRIIKVTHIASELENIASFQIGKSEFYVHSFYAHPQTKQWIPSIMIDNYELNSRAHDLNLPEE